MKMLWIIPIAAAAAMAQEPQAQQSQMQQRVIQRVEIVGPAGAMAGTTAFVGGQLINGAPVKGAPYSAEAVTETTQTLADGNRIVQRSSSMQYRDSDGRERRENSLPGLMNVNGGEPFKTIFISDPVAKASYVLNPRDQSAQKMPEVKAGNAPAHDVMFSSATAAPGLRTATSMVIGGVQIAGGMVTPGGAAKAEKLGAQTFDGVAAEGTRTTTTIAAGEAGNDRPFEITNERWYSPELQLVVMTRHNDPRMGETVYRLTSISRAEPARSLFEVPAGYTVSDGMDMKVRAEKIVREAKPD